MAEVGLVATSFNNTAPAESFRSGPEAPWAHRRPGYPSAGCLPAEPASVSPGTHIGPQQGASVQPSGHRSHASKNAGGLGAEPPASTPTSHLSSRDRAGTVHNDRRSSAAAKRRQSFGSGRRPGFDNLQILNAGGRAPCDARRSSLTGGRSYEKSILSSIISIGRYARRPRTRQRPRRSGSAEGATVPAARRLPASRPEARCSGTLAEAPGSRAERIPGTVPPKRKRPMRSTSAA